MTELATQAQATAITDYSGGLMEVIARAARDPSVDIDKMERLIAMQERVQARTAEIAYKAALSEMQSALPIISRRGGIKDRSGNVQSTYALWEDINEAVKPILQHYGFALSFRVRRAENEISVTGILSHREGHSEETELTLPTDTSGSKNAVQAVGSSAQYGKRYTAAALLNLTSRGEDDDGVRGGAPATITQDQAARIRSLMAEVKADEGRFLKYAKVRSIEDIAAADFEKAIAALEAKRGK